MIPKADVSIVNFAERKRDSGPLPDPREPVCQNYASYDFDPESFSGWRLALAWTAAFVTGWLVHEKQRAFRSAILFRMLGAAAVHPERTLITMERTARWRRAGALINTWTVNDDAEARQLAELGVDTIISDRPGAILQALAAR